MRRRLLCFSLLVSWALPVCCDEAPSPAYELIRTIARHEGPEEPSRLKLFTAEGVRELPFPAGSSIFLDGSADRFVVVRFMDRRFSAFASDGYDFVDLDTGKRTPVVRGVIYEAPDTPPNVLVGVRRVPIAARLIGSAAVSDSDYDEASFELFVLTLVPAKRAWYLTPVRTGRWLPDANQPYPTGEKPPPSAYVRDGTLFVATGYERDVFDEIPLTDLVP